MIQQLRDGTQEKFIDFIGKIIEFTMKFKFKNNGNDAVFLNFEDTPIYLNNNKIFFYLY